MDLGPSLNQGVFQVSNWNTPDDYPGRVQGDINYFKGNDGSF